MKEEALKLADELEQYCLQNEGYKNNDYVDMIRRLVEELDYQNNIKDSLRQQLAEKLEELDKQGEPVNWIYDNGKWQPAVTGKEVFVESDDFTHDVRLYINGDFEDMPQKYAYATEIAKRLNITPQTKPLSDEEIIKIYQTTLITSGHDFAYAYARAIEERHGIK